MLAFALILSASVSFASDKISDVPSIGQLINEVHQLRMALEQSSKLQTRTLVLLERIRLQRDIIKELTQAIESVRQESIAQVNQQGELEEQLKVLEAQQGAVPANPASIAEARAEILSIRKGLEQAKTLEAQFKEMARDHQSKLFVEENRLNELIKVIDELNTDIGIKEN
jgi:hypothetical protein